MHKQGRTGAKKNAIFLGRTWTARTVIRELRKDEIKRKIEEQFGARPGSSEMFQHYQTVLAEIIRGLSPDAIEQAELTAATWNREGASTEAKAR